MTQLYTAFYGDDFTGSAENLAQFRRHGLRCRLYFSPQEPDAVEAAAPELDVIGFAGAARALSPEAMTTEIEPAFALMQRLVPRVMQYKICSTVDSSPTVGSIGRVMDMARRRWPGCALPVFAATPAFGRYTAFSNHFTRYRGQVMRLDHNPAMANHPSTPMHEADLRHHLALQTDIPPAALTLSDYVESDGGHARLGQRYAEGAFVVLDAVTDKDVVHVARLVAAGDQERPTLAMAAQGLAHGLGRIWAEGEETVTGADAVPRVFPGVERLLILSGSCSPHTQRQLAELKSAGGTVIPISLEAMLDAPDQATEELLDIVLEHLKMTSLVALATTSRPEDVVQQLGGDGLAASLGAAFARVTRAATKRAGVTRVVFAGGDTSSYSMRSLGAEGLEIAVFDEAQSGHICRLVASDPEIDGLEVVLKGGQIGSDNLFVRTRTGTTG